MEVEFLSERFEIETTFGFLGSFFLENVVKRKREVCRCWSTVIFNPRKARTRNFQFSKRFEIKIAMFFL